MTNEIRVTVWNEFRHEKHNEAVKKVYPDGIHTAIAAHLQKQSMQVQVATLDEPEQGLTEDVLANTDVLTWWGHLAHDEVEDAIVDRVQQRILDDGMGLLVLHSGHYSKIFKRLMGTSCQLRWREAGEKERLWVAEPGHPIVEGLGDYIEIPHAEMYGEPFYIPTPESTIFISWFQGGEVFRSGCTYRRGRGKIFYFRPGHETYPIYYQDEIMHVITNGIRWLAPKTSGATLSEHNQAKPVEKL